jgi:uncharacterized coiled-coil protein SlyX
MDCIDTGWRNGWLLQANRLLNSHMVFTGSAQPNLVVAPQREPSPGDGQPSVAGAELQEALETTARLRRRLSQQRELSLTQRKDVSRLSEAAAVAEQQADALAQELADVRDQLGAELDSTVKEKDYIAELLLEKSSALDDACNRVGFLEGAVAAAETECTRLTAEMAKAAEREEAHAAACTRREHEAFAQVAEAHERLARAQQHIAELTAKNTAALEIIAAGRHISAAAVTKSAELEQDLIAQREREQEAALLAATVAERLANAEQELRELTAKNDAAERRIAAANLARANTAIENGKLETELAAQQARIAELEQAHAKLASKIETLTDALTDRDRSLAQAKAKIEALAKLALAPVKAAPPAAVKNSAKDAPRRSTARADGKARTREQWAELLAQLDQLMSLKRQAQPSPTSLLASTISFA